MTSFLGFSVIVGGSTRSEYIAAVTAFIGFHFRMAL